MFKAFVKSVAPVFQFHKGAIRTNDAVNASFRMLDFNSIKVRLEQGI